MDCFLDRFLTLGCMFNGRYGFVFSFSRFFLFFNYYFLLAVVILTVLFWVSCLEVNMPLLMANDDEAHISCCIAALSAYILATLFFCFYYVIILRLRFGLIFFYGSCV